MNKLMITLFAGLAVFANGQQNCSMMNCPPGQMCDMATGSPMCMNSTNSSKGCAQMTCPPRQMCDMSTGTARCQPSNMTDCSMMTCPMGTNCTMMSGMPSCMPNNMTKDCSMMTCPMGTNCTMMSGMPSCMPNNMTKDCSMMKCPMGTNCTMMSGMPSCMPNNMTKDCSMMKCPMGTNCTMMSGMPSCMPSNMTDCTSAPCPAGQKCMTYSGMSVCMPNNMTKDCSMMSCPMGTNCTMMSGMPSCMPNNMTKDCSMMSCPMGTNCTMMSGMPSCMPNNMTKDCSMMRCPMGGKCTMMSGMPLCMPKNMTDCTSAPCPAGQKCMTYSGMSVCMPNNMTKDCSMMSCPMGSNCSMAAGLPMCMPMMMDCTNTACGGFMKCEMMAHGKPMCVPAVSPSCDTFQCGPGMMCAMQKGAPMCKPSKSGMCGGSSGKNCPMKYECDVSVCNGTTDCTGVCVPMVLNEGDVCMSMSMSMKKDDSYLCKEGTTCQADASGKYTCQATTEVRCYRGMCASNQRCVVEDMKTKCIDIQKDPCDMCTDNQICTIDKKSGQVMCEEINACQELRHYQGMPPCEKDSQCMIERNTAKCKAGTKPTEDMCAGRAASSPDSTVAYCSASGRCPPGFTCSGCASTCTCDIFTGKEICNKVMCRPTCELIPVTIPCMYALERNATAEDREYCCDEEKIGCEVYDCMRPSPITSDAQKEFCCVQFPMGRWCGNTTQGYDCLSEPSMWTFEQRTYCCEMGIGCPVAQFDCSLPADAISFMDNDGMTIAVDTQATAGWSAARKQYCCDLTKVGCETPQPANNDCSGPENAPIWAGAKRQDCCRSDNVACEPKKDNPTKQYLMLLKECQASPITETKRMMCCNQLGLRCKATVHNCFEGTMWNSTKKDWCCTRENCGCSFDCTMSSSNSTQMSECCMMKGLQCTAVQQPKKNRTITPAAGMKGFRMAMKGSKKDIELNPKQFLRGVRKAIISTSKALLTNPKGLRISFVGWLKAGTNKFPSEEEVDNWGFPVPDAWNDENTDEEMYLKDFIATPKSRSASVLSNVQIVGEEGVFIEATTDADVVTEINTAVTKRDPTLADNADGNKYIIQPVGEEFTVDAAPSSGGGGGGDGDDGDDGDNGGKSDDDDSKIWIIPVVIAALLLGGGLIAFAVLRKKNNRSESTEGLGNFEDFTREQELKEDMVGGPGKI